MYRALKDPVLIAVGEYDRVVCGGTGSDCSSSAALQAQEAPPGSRRPHICGPW
ncbi:hypothetical protein [Streptomyces acidicola]|uniref:hypothetical protein n=1 Tax=Streptomyces acidicola TaxID=2596892 RepID=UPI00343D1B9B